MIGPNVRRFLAGLMTLGRVEKLSEEIKASLSSENSHCELNARAEIVRHAVENVPYYRRHGGLSLEELPVVTKNDMRSNLEDFLDENQRCQDLSNASTSGSTGIPFTAYFNREKVLRHRAGLVGTYKFMDANPYGSFIFCRAWSGIGVTQMLKLKAKDHLPFAGVHQDPKSVAQIVRWINRRDGVVVMGYSSYIEALLRAIIDLELTVRPGAVGAVVGGSEPPSSLFGSLAKQALDVAPQMRYSNMELGVIAVTCGNIDVYHIDTSSFHVEILREDSDTPCDVGESGRIVVTDLYNTAMPFLRYDTGDLGQFYVDGDGVELRNKLTAIKGRRLDVLLGGKESSPEKLHPLQIWGPTSKISEIRQFQLRQHAIGHFTWILNAKKSEQLEEQLRKILVAVVGPVEECNFTYVEAVR